MRFEGSGHSASGEERVNELTEFPPLGLGKKEEREAEDGGEPFDERLLGVTD